jgi:anaerobic ribonucleoside-triphosphate reductase activating protein
MLNLHAILPQSRANGPGVRTAIWFQGCTLVCPGCFNPDTHSSEPRLLAPPEQLVARIAAEQDGIEGITLSGGEPLQQAEGLLELLCGVRLATRLSVVLFSGYTLEEILAMPLGRDILAHVDVLIDGRYDQMQRLARGLRGSGNQRIHFLTGRYSLEDLNRVPRAEVFISPDGRITATGINPVL